MREELGAEYRECSSVTGVGIEEVFATATRMALVKQGVIRSNTSSNPGGGNVQVRSYKSNSVSG